MTLHKVHRVRLYWSYGAAVGSSSVFFKE